MVADRQARLCHGVEQGSCERIGVLLREYRLPVQTYTTWKEAQKLRPGTVGLLTLGLDRGFVADNVAFVSEQDLLGERISRPPRRRKKADQFISEASEIAEGD